MKITSRIICFLLAFTTASPSFAGGPPPHIPTFCAGLLRTAAQDKGNLAAVIYSLRDFRQQLTDQLHSLRSQKRIRDYLPNNMLARALVQKYVSTDGHYRDIYSQDMSGAEMSDRILFLKKEIGRLNQLEEDIAAESENHLSATYEIRGEQKISAFINELENVNSEAESKIGPAIDLSAAQMDQKRRAGLTKTLAATGIFGLMAFTIMSGLIHHHALNPWTAAEVLAISGWATKILPDQVRRLVGYIKPMFNKTAVDNGDDASRYRAITAMQTLEAIKADLSGPQPSGAYQFYGSHLLMTQQMMRSLANNSAPASDYYKELALLANFYRRNEARFSADNVAIGFFDFFYYHDSSTGEPVLVVTARLVRGLKPPRTPRKRDKSSNRQTKSIETFDGVLAPAQAG